MPAEEALALTGAHVPLQFVAQNTLQVGTGPNAWDYNAPTPITHTTEQDIAYSGFTASQGDWFTVIAAAAAIASTGAGVAAGSPTTPAMFAVASVLSGAAANGAYQRVGHDILWGIRHGCIKR